MIAAVIGSRNTLLSDDQIASNLPPGTTKLLSGGAIGVDQCVRRFAEKRKIHFLGFLPQYTRYGKAAPLVRNEEMVRQADRVVAFWVGASKGTHHGILFCEKEGTPIRVVLMEPDTTEQGKD